jgi:hypothetical protein
MSIFGSIMSAIFGKANAQGAAAAGGAASPPTAPSATPVSAPANQSVDIEAVVGGMAAKKKEKLDWRRSIVDLMKVLDLDSSLAARKELAQELGYKGELNGSAEMNIWLHKQVMKKLAENGGKVPAELTA